MPKRSDMKQMDLKMKYKPFIITKLIFVVSNNIYFNKIQEYITILYMYKKIMTKLKKKSGSLLNSFSEMI